MSESVAAEVLVFVLLGPWLLNVLGRSGSLALATGAAVMRWGVMAQTADVTAMALVEPLHGLTFALFHLGCMRIIADTVPSSLAGMAQGVLWNCRDWRSNGAVDHTCRLAVRTLGGCRILGNGFFMLPSPSHLELALGAFTRFQPLEVWATPDRSDTPSPPPVSVRPSGVRGANRLVVNLPRQIGV